MLKISLLNHTHFDEIVDLVTQRYSAMLEYCLLLPAIYTQPEVVVPLLESIVGSAPGVVAYDEGRLAGFIAGWKLGNFRGYPTVYSPEWANAAQFEGSRRIYEAMYTQVAKPWLEQGYTAHLIGQYTDRPDMITGWHWLGFGLCAADGIRSLQPIDQSSNSLKIKRASVEDYDVVMDLVYALTQHHANSPTFLYTDEKITEDNLVALLSDPDEVFWLANRDGKVIGYLKHGPASDMASQIIVDPGTTSIRGCYTLPAERGRGVAASLLNHTLAWSKAQGYKRCCVDFEPMNVLAARFWTRHFQIVTLSMMRHFDPRFVP